MKDFITTIALIIIAIAPFVFLAGFVQVFNKERRQIGIKLMVLSVVAFIVGFGMCSSNMSGF
jgi:hypothetical protein